MHCLPAKECFMNELIDQQLIHELKREDSEMWCVKNESHIALPGQTTIRICTVTKYVLWRIWFDKFCLRRILFHKNWSAAQRRILLVHHTVVHLIPSILFCLPIHGWCKWFELQYSVITSTQFVPNSNKEHVKWRTISQIKPRETQFAKQQFNSRTVYKKQHTSAHVTKKFTITRLVCIRMTRHCDDTVGKNRVNFVY